VTDGEIQRHDFTVQSSSTNAHMIQTTRATTALLASGAERMLRLQTNYRRARFQLDAAAATATYSRYIRRRRRLRYANR